QGQALRIIDGSGDVVIGERHLALKLQAEAYASAYNRALAAWLRAHPQAVSAGPADQRHGSASAGCGLVVVAGAGQAQPVSAHPAASGRWLPRTADRVPPAALG